MGSLRSLFGASAMNVSRQPAPRSLPIGKTAIFRRRKKVDGCVLYLGYHDGELAAVEKVRPGESEAAAVDRLATILWPTGPVPYLRLLKAEPSSPPTSSVSNADRQRCVRALLTRAARAPLPAALALRHPT